MQYFFLIMGMEEAFHQEKGKHGKCQSADAGQPPGISGEGSPQVITEHERHSEDMQRQSTEIWWENRTMGSFVLQNKTPFKIPYGGYSCIISCLCAIVKMIIIRHINP